MKNSLLLVSVLIWLSCSAQLEKVNDGLEGPIGIAFDEDKLFIAESMGEKVSFFYVDNQPPVMKTALQGLEYPVGLTVADNNLFVSELGSLFSVPRVLKVSMNEIGGEASFIVVLEYLNTPVGVAFANDYLYITDFDKNKILKINSKNDKPRIDDVLIKLAGPSDILIRKEYVFLAERTSGSISRKSIFDLSVTGKEVLVDKLDKPEGIALNGDYLYFSSLNNNIISRIDISNGLTSVVEEVVEVNEPGARLAFYGDILYISQRFEGAIYKFTPKVIGVDENENEKIVLFPNPASYFITIKGAERRENIQVVSLNGAPVMSINAKESGRVNISHLQAGVYFIRVNHQRTLKFVKR